jgi:hypothetical protein
VIERFHSIQDFGWELLRLAGCYFGHSVDLHENFLFAEDQAFLSLDLDVVAGVFAEQDAATHLHIERDTFAVSGMMIPPFAVSFSSSAYQNSVVQRSYIHSHSLDLPFIYSNSSSIQPA